MKIRTDIFVLIIFYWLCIAVPLHTWAQKPKKNQDKTAVKSDSTATDPAAHPLPPALLEIKELYDKDSYAIVLEKALGLINTGNGLVAEELSFLHYYTGMSYDKNNNSQMAVDYLKQVHQKFPTTSYVKKAYLELARLVKTDYFQKVSYLEKTFENYPRTEEAVKAGNELSKDYIRLKNFKKALPVLETLVNLWKKDTDTPELNMMLAVAYSGIRDYIEALVYLRITEKKIPDIIIAKPQYLFEAGNISYNNADFKMAIKYLEKLFNIFPGYKQIPAATALLAMSYEKENKLFMSAVFLIKAIEKKPVKKDLYTLYLNLGRIMGKLTPKEMKIIAGNYPLYSNPNKMLTIVRNNSKNFEETRTAAILLSGELKKSNNMEESINNFHKFLREKRDPIVEKMFKKDLDTYLKDLDKKEDAQKLFQAWVKLKRRKSYLSGENLLRFGKILYKLKLYSNAEEVYKHLLKFKMFSKLWVPSWQQMVRIKFNLGKWQECLLNINHLDIDKEPERSEFNYYKAGSLRRLNKEEELKKLLDAVEIKTIFTEFQYLMARLKAEHFEKQSNYTDALEYYQKMLKFSSVTKKDEGHLMVSIADMYFKVNDPESALSYYRLAEQYNTNQEWVLFRIVSLLRQLKKKEEAKLAMEKLEKLNPKSFWVKQLKKNF